MDHLRNVAAKERDYFQHARCDSSQNLWVEFLHSCRPWRILMFSGEELLQAAIQSTKSVEIFITKRKESLPPILNIHEKLQSATKGRLSF